ncbi:MAG: hypothetical protein ACE5LQ_05845, partial [Candidatus Bipolaricaulia bacterium]
MKKIFIIWLIAGALSAAAAQAQPLEVALTATALFDREGLTAGSYLTVEVSTTVGGAGLRSSTRFTLKGFSWEVVELTAPLADLALQAGDPSAQLFPLPRQVARPLLVLPQLVLLVLFLQAIVLAN